MVILRATAKARRFLPHLSEPADASDTALGDWYVNRIVVARKPLLLLISSASLLPILTPARDVKNLPGRLPELVRDRLERLGVTEPLIQAEVSAMSPVIVAKTADRSVLGILVDFANAVSFYANFVHEDDLSFVEGRLAETPCYAGRGFEKTIFPSRKAPELLYSHWS